MTPSRSSSGQDAPFDIYAWQQEYLSAFDRQGNASPERLKRLANQLETALQESRYRLRAEERGFYLSRMLEVSLQLRDWSKAERYGRELAREAGTAPQRRWVHQRLAGLSAVQNQWSQATHYYLLGQRDYYLTQVGPAILLNLGWLLIWVSGSVFRCSQRLSPKTLRNLGGVALLPLFIALFQESCLLVMSFLWTGNPGTAIVSYRAQNLTLLGVSFAWSIGTLLLSWWLFRRLPAKETPLQEESGPSVPLGKVRFQRLCFYTSLVLVGLFLDHTVRAGGLFPSLTSQESILARAGLQGSLALYGLALLVETSILSPIAQEWLFRGVIYTYTRQEVGIAFGVMFSSSVFASIHLESERYVGLFFVGLIYLTQYEASRRLLVPILTHGITNFLVSLHR